MPNLNDTNDITAPINEDYMIADAPTIENQDNDD